MKELVFSFHYSEDNHDNLGIITLETESEILIIETLLELTN